MVIQAVDNVTLDIQQGETLGLVGESGCGKSTIAQLLVGLHEATAGQVTFNGEALQSMPRKERKRVRRQLQYVFQDPNDSLDPRMKVRDIIAEGLWADGSIGRKEIIKRVEEVLDRVGLPRDALGRFPHEFSGGQRQRIGIARALVMRPQIIVADEPISALDVSVQAQILNLLGDLKRELGLTYVFVAHNLAAVAYVSDRIAVMYLGRIVEIGTTREIMSSARHPYTKALLSAIPEPEIGAERRERITLSGDVPSPVNPPSGCRFRTRCPIATELCANEAPSLAGEIESGPATTHLVACHFA
ncbi:oligopeptide/dipeptide ABC transporter ATP-binding protein [uncultured Agrobacterium sp.]